MTKIFYAIFLMATLVVAIIFSTLNFNSTPFHYLFGQAKLPLSVLLVTAFVGGFIAGLLLDAWVMYRQRARIRNLEQQLKVCESELSNLRKLPLRDFS